MRNVFNCLFISSCDQWHRSPSSLGSNPSWPRIQINSPKYQALNIY